jgi:hypothetical protein
VHPGLRVTADPKTISPATQGNVPDSSGNHNGINFSTATPEKPNATDGWRIWLHRVRALLLVTMCATFGVLLLIVPWTSKWTDNPLLLSSPQLRNIVSSGFVRGMASGLGLLDLWLGFWEAIHYHEGPKSSNQ